MMGQFTVIATFTDGDGYIQRTEQHEAADIYDAFREFGRQAARSNGVIVIDEHDCVWAEHRPAQIEHMSDPQRIFYRHYAKREAA
jgi:aromatic ring-opening dioxygenase LigB subunit